MTLRIGVALLAALLSMPALGEPGVVTANVASVRIDASGHGMVFFDQPVFRGSNGVSCVTAEYQNALAFNNDAAGKAIMAAALAAKAMGSPMQVWGTGTCTFYGSWVENWSHGKVL
jgi:hypothetical protein